MQKRIDFFFLNVGHFFDHFFILIFATAAALVLAKEWELSYAELIPYATPGFIAFGLGAIPAGWMADKWSRKGMMAIFFVGIGASAALTAFADTPFEMGLGLLAVGAFAAIYHPVGIALVVETHQRTGVALAINGVFGNLGVASAALVTALFIDTLGWRWAFAAPGLVSIAIGLAYWVHIGKTWSDAKIAAPTLAAAATTQAAMSREAALRVYAVILLSTAIGGLIFQAATFALPKILDERLDGLATSATQVGWYAFVVLAIASIAQLVVGSLIDRRSARTVFAVVALAQAILFWAMQQLSGPMALIVAGGFMFAVFGQIPITDVLVGRMARGPWRSRIFAMKYVVSFLVSATAIPVIAWVYATSGFDLLFAILAVCAAAVFIIALMLPGKASVVLGTRAPEPAE